MDELTDRKNEIARSMTAIELTSAEIDEAIDVHDSIKCPLSTLAALGTAFQPVLSAFQKLVGAGGDSGFYYVKVPPGAHLAHFKNSADYLGTSLSDVSNQIYGQAHLTMAVDPTMLFMAATLVSFDQKLSVIQENQQDMMDFLVQQDKSRRKGDLNFLMEVYNNYKYNWNNEKYKAANHIKALDIRQEAEWSIDFCREQIKKQVGKHPLMYRDGDVKKQIDAVAAQFKEYQMALYLYGFSCFVEVLLQENYNSDYLDSIEQKMEDYAFRYRELYTKTFNMIDNRTRASLESRLLHGLSEISRSAGELIAKIPVVSDSPVDEMLIDSGTRLGQYTGQRRGLTMSQLIVRQSNCILPFRDNIATINRLYNNSFSVVFNSEALYISAEPDN
ncbi:MAG: hypothetical protein LUC30_03945 [Clostridiales bacterium]|nr:hypothetical protein [Clostridiales bacterium]